MILKRTNTHTYTLTIKQIYKHIHIHITINSKMAGGLHVELPDKEDVGTVLLHRRGPDDQSVRVVLERPVKLFAFCCKFPITWYQCIEAKDKSNFYIKNFLI